MTVANSSGVTRWIESRLPRRRTSIFESDGSAFSSASVTTRGNARTRRTSTATQRGASRGDVGSQWSDFESNCDASGYASRATSATPATPVGSALEW